MHLSKGTRPGKAGGKAWTRKEFAVTLNIKESTLSRWLSGDYLPNNIYAIARALFGTINPGDNASLAELNELFRKEKRERLQK
jgi:transcriptional regulator with XRE-family HTH domain